VWKGLAVRFIVYGAGAVGGVVGGRLAEHGYNVVLIARGAHAEAMRRSGLTIESPDTTASIDVAVVLHPSELDFRADDVVLLGMKSQDTHAALLALRATAVASTPIVCLQNGVENERAALRLFENVYGINVMCPAGHLEPGVVQAFSSPVSGILDLGRYPSGVDDTAQQLAAALERATFVSEVRADIVRWKYAKLLMNLGNAVQALFGRAAARGPIGELVRAEGIACLTAAGIDFASAEEDRVRRGDLLQVRPIGDRERPGGSSWQSLERRTGAIESDYLNGEVVLLGRLHGVPTPANALLQRLAAEAAAAGAAPGSLPPDVFLQRLGATTH
jgi:2-dehydropantoate 2-reductase